MSSRLTSIVAIDRNGAIGCRNALPWKLQSDMAFFRETTTNNTVIMGRKTFDSIGKPLGGRKNVVLSHNATLFPSTSDCQLALSIPEALVWAEKSRSRDIFVIGGAATYLEFAPLIDRYLLTVVDCVVGDADAFLSPEILEEIGKWESIEIGGCNASKGKDDFAFKIFEIEAPDSHERAYDRQKLVSSYLIKQQKSSVTRPRKQIGFGQTVQETFAF